MRDRLITIAASVAVGLCLLAVYHFLYHHRPAGDAISSASQSSAGHLPVPPAGPTFADSNQNPISAQEAFERILAAAEAGSTSAMINVAEFYGNGWAVRQDFTQRFQWLEKAAKAGDSRGAYLTGQALELGLGVTVDQAAAMRAFEQAAGLGLPAAHFRLAQGLLAGPEADPLRAVVHLEEALASGLPQAANMLGILYLQGAGNLEADAGKARLALQKGADLADPEALKNLAVMYKEGWGGPADPAQALKWYLAAREAGWRGEDIEGTLAELEGQAGAQAAKEAEAEARAWLADRRPPAEASSNSHNSEAMKY